MRVRIVFMLMVVGVFLATAGGVASAAPAPTPPVAGPGPLLSAVYPPTVQGAIHRQFASFGPLSVAVSQKLNPCDQDLYGRLQVLGAPLAGGKDGQSLKCSNAFPHGPSSPINVIYYYPRDIASLGSLPAIVWVPGFDGDGGQYDPVARLWASRGFVVAIPYNFINSFSTEHLWGTQALIREEGRLKSPLHGHVDFSRTMLGGHSGGAGSLINAASYMPPMERRIDRRLHLVGALSVATGINGPIGTAITIPTLTITGTRDLITEPFLWPYWAYATTQAAPAYIAPAVNAGHLAMTDQIPNNPAAGLSMAWFEHLAGGHSDADAVFVGRNWSLPRDSAFVDVKRNGLATRLR